MKFYDIVFFIVVVLFLYGGVNLYLYKRTVFAAGFGNSGRRMLKIILLISIFAYPAGIAAGGENPVGRILLFVGAYWMGFMVYGFILSVVFEVFRYLDHLTGWFPRGILIDSRQARRLSLLLILTTVIVILIGGRIRAMYPVVKEITLEVDPMVPDRDEYYIAMFSDSHFGFLFGEKRARSTFEIIETYAPDLCIIPGDILEERPENVEWLSDLLANLEVSDGIFASPGNHEYYVDLRDAINFLEASGVRVLNNEIETIPNVINVIGLGDSHTEFEFGIDPVSIDSLTGFIENDLPVVLMHHTPQRMQEAAAAGVDLMVSGHTHGGQLWPANFVIQLLYGISQGHHTFDGMNFYLTNGVGTWGPPFRVAMAPEIVIFTLVPVGAEIEEEEY